MAGGYRFFKLLTVFVLLISVFLNSCSKEKEDIAPEENDESIVLDYTVHPLKENVKWVTNENEPVIASPEAKQGGTFNAYMLTFPLTFRTVGPDSNNYTRSYFLDNQLSLINYHSDTEKLLPELATHWGYSKDGRTMYFKLNPAAKWSDGTPVTPDDFIFTLEFMRSRHIQAPWYNDYYTKEIEKVTKHGDLVLSVTATKKIPDLWMTVAISPTPKHFYKKINKDYITEYNWKIEPNTGPYILKDFSKGKYLLFEKKKEWWAKDLRYFKNRFNVEFIRIEVIRDPNVAFEYFRKGLIDSFDATRPEIWFEKGSGDIFDKGYVNKLWYYNKARRPTSGLYLNLDKEIFKDRNLRYALAHAINFDKLNSQILRNEAVRLNTFYEGYGAYTNSKIKAREFNIPKAESYMKTSGWKRGADGIWQKGGRRYSVTISYGQEQLTPRVVILQEEAKKAGIEINLELLDASTSYKKVMEKKHDIAYMAWSTSFRPSPWQSFHSDNAHKAQTNNINNIDDPEMDRFIERYRASTNEKERILLAHKIQQKLHDSGAWIPLNTLPFFREFHWRWMKFPDVPGFRDTGTVFDNPAAGGYFWVDDEMKKETRESLKSGKTFEPVTRIITKYK
ncbi:MAG TPA: extracellular solute-binding protein [Spirochaetota bacterium]|nr:extracellular solute-binding protein [Spirochaetota bacterium]HRX45879.1 extracellular solute-binding protein [Spirochaetota bacterium]